LLSTVRAALTRDDAQLVLQLLAHGSGTELEAAEDMLRDGGLDALLDDPRLLPALMENERALSDYVAAILLHFGMRDRARRVSEHDDQSYDSLVALLDDVDGPDARRNFLVLQHLGNYALWLSGLFPDYIEQRRWRRGGPDLAYYEEMGRRGFHLAASHRLAHEQGMDVLFRVAAERFAVLRVALNGISDVLMFPHCHTPERLMRQVRDEARWKLS